MNYFSRAVCSTLAVSLVLHGMAVELTNSIYYRASLLPWNGFGVTGILMYERYLRLLPVDDDSCDDLISATLGCVVYGTNISYNSLVNPRLTNIIAATQLIYSNGWSCSGVIACDRDRKETLLATSWLFDSELNGYDGGALLELVHMRPPIIVVDPRPTNGYMSFIGSYPCVRLPPKVGQAFKVDRCGIMERKRSNE